MVITTPEEILRWHLPFPGHRVRILNEHGKEVLFAGVAHADAECKEKQRRYGFRLVEYPGIRVTPEEAIKEMEKRILVLAGGVEADIVLAVKKIMLDHLAGTGRAQTEEKIADLRKFTESRASLITTTETTYVYNFARMISYRENHVDYVRFTAIMDARTSPQCKSRHGLVMAMDDPALAANTPPLHGRCRSLLTTIYGRYEPELITVVNTNWAAVVALPKGWVTRSS